MRIRLRIVLLIIVAVIAGLYAIGWYTLHNPDRYIAKITAYLQQKTGLRIEIRHIEVNLLPLSVRVYGLEVKNPKPFPAGDFLKVPELYASVALAPLLDEKVSIRSLVLDRPVMDFISDPDGLWNFQNPATPKEEPTRLSLDVISNVQIKDGVLLGSNLIDPSDAPGPIILEVRNFSAQLNQINLRKIHHPGTFTVIQGNIDASNARFGAIHTTDLRSQLRIAPKRFAFKNFQTKTYRGRARGDFSFNFGGKNTTFDSVVNVNGIGVPYLLAEFQSAPTKGPAKLTGMMQANLKLGGTIEHTANPLAYIHGTGTITIRKGELPGLDRNKEMIQMKRLRDPSTEALPVSAFSTFAGDVNLRNRRVYSKHVDLDFYGVDVRGTGSTSVMGSGAMKYRGIVTILTKQGFFTNAFARMFKGAKEKNGRLKFPIRITGTLANPQCSVAD